LACEGGQEKEEELEAREEQLKEMNKVHYAQEPQRKDALELLKRCCSGAPSTSSSSCLCTTSRT
jgi:hypothetical protein